MYHFLNLTNGIEALPDLKKLGSENISFIRIQSSWIERGLWVDILRELDHHFLMMLSLDKPVYVYDFGAKKNFSKTLRIGFPFIKFVLEKEWLGKSSKVIHYNHAGNPVNHSYLESQFENIYLDIFYHNSTPEKEKVKTKIRYYRKYSVHFPRTEVNIKLIGNATEHDNDLGFYLKQLIYV